MCTTHISTQHFTQCSCYHDVAILYSGSNACSKHDSHVSQTHATVACLLAWWVPSHCTTVFQHVPEITCIAQVNPCDGVGDLEDIEGYMCHCSPPARRRRSPSYEKSRRRSPSYDRSRRRSPSSDRRRRSPSPPPRRRRSPSPDRHASSHNQQMLTGNYVHAFIRNGICHCIRDLH